MRFGKRIKIAPGVKLNLSKSGISTSVGKKGLSVNIGEKGTYLNTGIPGTGLHSRDRLDSTTPDTETPQRESVFVDNMPKIGPLGMLSGFMMLAGIAAFILFLFIPGWGKRLLALAIFILGFIIARVMRKKEPPEGQEKGQVAP
jgi:type IV secretory pathway TrbD component